jgi:O-methyltransferase involved in polyketide biosynthesis
VPVNLAHDRLADALSTAGHRSCTPTTWIWEGVVPYLDRADVKATVAAVADLSAPGSRLVVNYQAPSLRATPRTSDRPGDDRVARRPNLWKDEPRDRPGHLPPCTLVATNGFTTDSDNDLLSIAGQLALPVRQRRSLSSGRVATATR